MPQRALLLGVTLMILGIVGYVMSGGASMTPLIPAFFGLLFIITGVLGKKEHLRKHAMHVAAGVSLFGLIGSFPGLMKLIGALGGAEVARPAAVIAQSIMAILCLAFLIIAVKSFIDARKQRST